MARRFAGILVALLMLHLGVAGADFGCSRHGDHTAKVHGQATGHHHGHGHRATTHAEEAPASQQPCETPTQPACCRAMMSCAITLAFKAGSVYDSAPPTHERIRSGASRLPLSLITSPEPPPPRV